MSLNKSTLWVDKLYLHALTYQHMLISMEGMYLVTQTNKQTNKQTKN